MIFSGQVQGNENDFTTVKLNGIVLHHPDDWFGLGSIEDVFYLFPVEEQGKEFQSNINLIYENLEEEMTLGVFYRETIEGLKEVTDDFEKRNEKEILLDGRKAKKILFSGFLPDVSSEDKLKWMQIIAVDEGRVLVLTYTSLEERFEKFEQDVLQIINSFEFGD